MDNNKDGKCDFGDEPSEPAKPPTPYYPYEPKSKYQVSFNYGVTFVNQLLYNQWISDIVTHKCEKNWWSEYMGNGEKRWRMMLSLAFDWESHSMRNNPGEWPTFRDLELEAFSRKYWYFFDGYGVAGKYIFLGSMETVRRRTTTFETTKNIDKSRNFEDVYENLIPKVLRGEWRGALRNRPFDFGNPSLATSEKYYLHEAVKNHNKGPNPSQIFYFTPDFNAFIITYDQWVCLNKPEKRPDGQPWSCCNNYQNGMTPP